MLGTQGELLEYHTHYRWATIIVVVVFLILLARLFYVQVIEGERYEGLALISHVVKHRIVPARGAIRDRNGTVLATDVEVADLTMVPQYVKDPKATTGRMVELGVLTQDEADKIVRQIEEAKKGKKKFHRLVAYKNLVGNRCPEDLTALSFDRNSGLMVCPVCGAEYMDQKAVIQSHLHELQGFSIQSRMVRHYPMRSAFVHALGFVNEVNAEEVAAHPKAYRPGDLIGRTGIEGALDADLRGKPGLDSFVRMAGGARMRPEELPEMFKDLQSYPPEPGTDITLSVDLNLQQVALAALSRHRSGAVVVMDVHTGEVLVMASHPSLPVGPRLHAVTGSAARDIEVAYAPMVNKAVSAYPPGSTFKPMTVVGGFVENIFDYDTVVNCPGHFDYRGRRFHCYKRTGHGDMSLIPSLAQSCDTYYYQLGEIMGIDLIAHYAKDWFGIGEKTGVEIYEQSGVMPTESWYREKGVSFQPGFAINSSVGQGDVRATPLGMARAYAALVNGGLVLKPKLVRWKGPHDLAHDKVQPEIIRRLDIPEQLVQAMMAGMYDAVNNEQGTAFKSAIPDLPYAGKTGTAQARERRPDVSNDVAAWLLQDHAWFVAYAPAKRPQVVVSVFVEHGGFGGAEAAPVAKKVIEAYYAEHSDEFADLWEGFKEQDALEVIWP